MRKFLKSVLALAFCMITAAGLPLQAFAAGKINTDAAAALTVVFRDGEKPVPGSRFDIYRVADVNEYADMILTEQFLPYRDSVEGLSSLETMDHDSWLNLAATLKGIVQRDAMTPLATGYTGEDGTLPFAGLKVGLYLVIGYRATTDDYYTYSAVPFMAFLPDLDMENNEWVYSLSVCPKFTKDFCPPDDPDDRVITRKVLKIWDDEGFESLRPESIEITLMRDGAVYDTQFLTAENSWRYAWDNLDPEYDWTVAERVPAYYSMSLSQEGITFIFKNKYMIPISGDVPIAVKKLTGNRPLKPSLFTFELKAVNSSFPMPEGSIDGVKQVTIAGAGPAAFGKITFTVPGVYTYTVTEINSAEFGYTYDATVYLLTYFVTEVNGELDVRLEVKDTLGNEFTSPTFTNIYMASWLIPQTGALWWPVPVMLALGIVLLCFGAAMRRRAGKGKWLLVAGTVFFVGAAGLTGYNMADNVRAGKAADYALEQVMQEIPAPAAAQAVPTGISEQDASAYDLPVYPDYVLNPKMDMPVKKMGGNGYVGVIDIPAIERKLAVIDEWSYGNLETSACRYEGTPYLGNMIVCAHNYDTHFGPLKTLRYGDEVTFTDIDGNEFRYHVAEMEILQPEELERLRGGEWDLTLFTCTLGGNTRVVARCEKEST